MVCQNALSLRFQSILFHGAYSLSELCLSVDVTDVSFRYAIFVENHNEGDALSRYSGDMKIMGKFYVCEMHSLGLAGWYHFHVEGMFNGVTQLNVHH